MDIGINQYLKVILIIHIVKLEYSPNRGHCQSLMEWNFENWFSINHPHIVPWYIHLIPIFQGRPVSVMKQRSLLEVLRILCVEIGMVHPVALMATCIGFKGIGRNGARLVHLRTSPVPER